MICRSSITESTSSSLKQRQQSLKYDGLMISKEFFFGIFISIKFSAKRYSYPLQRKYVIC